MARQPVYQQRGLKLPGQFLKLDAEEDLCDACALGKPTFDFSRMLHSIVRISKVSFGLSTFREVVIKHLL